MQFTNALAEVVGFIAAELTRPPVPLPMTNMAVLVESSSVRTTVPADQLSPGLLVVEAKVAYDAAYIIEPLATKPATTAAIFTRFATNLRIPMSMLHS